MGKPSLGSLADRARRDPFWNELAASEAAALRGRRPPIGLLVRLIDDEEGMGRAVAESEGDDLYEYLVNHEMIFPDARLFHVCTAHPAAVAAIRSGRIGRSFSCGRGAEQCPMRRVVEAAGGLDIELTLVREVAHG